MASDGQHDSITVFETCKRTFDRFIRQNRLTTRFPRDNWNLFKGVFNLKIDAEDEQLLEDVWDTYGDNTGNALEALTHRELPWMEARRGYEPDERCSVVISPTTMASYYKSIYAGD